MDESFDKDQQQFVRELVIVARRWRNRLDERLKSIGMSQARWAALYWLDQSPAGLSQTALAERAGVEAPSLVRLIDLLEAQGLVVRRVSEKDRRSKLVQLTPAAGPVIAEIVAVSDQLRREVMKDVSREDMTVMLRLLGSMRSALGTDAADRVEMDDAISS